MTRTTTRTATRGAAAAAGGGGGGGRGRGLGRGRGHGAGAGASRSARRLTRRHRSTLRQLDRRALERSGWRTTLELRENHERLATGLLIDVDRSWIAEAERDGVVISCSARSESRAWSQVCVEANRLLQGSSDAITAAASA